MGEKWLLIKKNKEDCNMKKYYIKPRIKVCNVELKPLLGLSMHMYNTKGADEEFSRGCNSSDQWDDWEDDN
jgi:hypothetical protein